MTCKKKYDFCSLVNFGTMASVPEHINGMIQHYVVLLKSCNAQHQHCFGLELLINSITIGIANYLAQVRLGNVRCNTKPNINTMILRIKADVCPVSQEMNYQFLQ